jgi:hypothetical protein
MASYTDVTVSSYDSSPPIDDGTVTASNKIAWATIKTKLGDPLNTAVGSVDDNIAAAITTITANMVTSTSNLASSSSTYTTRAANLYAPTSTAALFVQTAAPTGWTKSATHNNKALRLVSGAASSGGTTAFTSILASRTLGYLPSHTHSWSASASNGSGITLSISGNTHLITDFSESDTQSGVDGSGGTSVEDNLSESEEALSGTVTIASTATAAAGSGTGMDFAVRYVDVIFATKDA